MKTIYVAYEENRSGGEDDGPWHHTPIYIDFRLKGASFDKSDDWYSESFDISVDTTDPVDVYFVVVRYSGGSTFGQTYGNGCIHAAFLDERDAQDMAKRIRTGEYTHYTWTGYFNNLESVEVFVTTVQSNASSAVRF